MFAQHIALELWSAEYSTIIKKFSKAKKALQNDSQPMQLTCLSSIHYKILKQRKRTYKVGAEPLSARISLGCC